MIQLCSHPVMWYWTKCFLFIFLDSPIYTCLRCKVEVTLKDRQEDIDSRATELKTFTEEIEKIKNETGLVNIYTLSLINLNFDFVFHWVY